jgi:IS30 family transposase
MANIQEKTGHQKFKQLNSTERTEIANCLARGLNLTDTARVLNCSISTIKKEIDRNKTLKINQIYKNCCGLKKICNERNVCGNSKCTHKCSDCKMPNVHCNEHCKNYTQLPVCDKLKKICGVCNGCDEYKKCTLNKWIYDSHIAQENHLALLGSCHCKVRITEAEAIEFVKFLKPLIEQNLSLYAIKSKYPTKFKYSVQTVYNWIAKGVLKGIDNVMLPRKVKYKGHKSKNKEVDYDRSYLIGRQYDEFIKYITEHPYDEVVEMDTVEGVHHSSFILTLLFRKSNFMLAFKLKDHTAQSVVDVLNKIKEDLGNDLFKQTFKVILTDRGSEFSNPDDIEYDKDKKEKLTRVFYCDSRQSQQKGKIEKNHVELRKIFPKGFNFNDITQDQLNLALSHVNSYPRKILNGKSPYELFSIYTNPLVLNLNNSKRISFKNLILNKSLIK